MAALNEHARLPVFVDGIYLREVSSIDYTGESGQVRIETLEGLVGFSPGVGAATIKLNSAIPIAGLEYDFHNAMVDGTIVTVQLGVGSRMITFSGKVTSDGFSQSTGAASENTATIEGALTKSQ